MSASFKRSRRRQGKIDRRYRRQTALQKQAMFYFLLSMTLFFKHSKIKHGLYRLCSDRQHRRYGSIRYSLSTLDGTFFILSKVKHRLSVVLFCFFQKQQTTTRNDRQTMRAALQKQTTLSFHFRWYFPKLNSKRKHRLYRLFGQTAQKEAYDTLFLH